MMSADGARLPLQDELVAAAAATEGDVRFLAQHDFSDVAAEAYPIVRTGETRTYGNVNLRKGVVGVEDR